MPSDVGKRDAPLGDQPPREALGGMEDLGRFGHRKQPV
jgi:hypothetical protein